MDWKFDYTVPSFCILIILGFFYAIRPKLYMRVNRAFILLFVTEFFTDLFVLIYSITSDSFLFYDLGVIYMAHILYFMLYIARVYSFVYFYIVLFEIPETRKSRHLIPELVTFVVAELFIAANVFTKYLFIIDQHGHYSRGRYYIFINIISIILYFITFAVVIKKRKMLTNLSFAGAITPVVVLMFGTILRVMFNKYMLMNMFYLFAIVILLLIFENPDLLIDSRTQLFNRKAFGKFVQEMFYEKKPYDVIAFVITNYSEKRIIYGGTQMNSGLTEIGKFLKQNFIGYTKFYTRNGHFIMISRKCNNSDKFIDMIRQRFKLPWQSESAQLYLNVKFIAFNSSSHCNSAEDMIECLRVAYDDVEKSNDCEILKIDLNRFETIGRRGKVRRALDYALKNNEVKLYLQPIVESKTRKIISAEALARIEDDELGIIPPSEFISIAEKTGVIEELGEQMLSKTFDFIKKYDADKYGIEWINVNLSPIQCQNYHLPSRISKIAEYWNVKSNRIHLEITEESKIDQSVLERQMKILIEKGYCFSLDDYGAGFSNILRVKQLPFNNIKIDMQVIFEHFKSPDNFLPGTVSLFTERGLSVTAEGVETKEMADTLEKMGCTYLQGYYFSKPVPAEEFIKLIGQ